MPRRVSGPPQGLELEEKNENIPPLFFKNQKKERGGICAPSAKHGIVPGIFKTLILNRSRFSPDVSNGRTDRRNLVIIE